MEERNLQAPPIEGDENDNQLIGTPQNDVINGNGGGDQLIGNGGNDILTGGAGEDNIIGGEGIDTARFDDAPNAVTILEDPDQPGRIIAARLAINEDGVAIIEENEISGIEQVVFPETGGSILVDGIVEVTADEIENAINEPEDGDGLANVVNPQENQDLTINGDENDNVLVGGAGDDTINGLGGNDTLTGGLGNDTLDGGADNDTASFNDLDVGVTADLANGSSTRVTGFQLVTSNAPLASLTTGQSPSELFDEAAAGNLYFNIHTNDFPGGEIRGQLTVEDSVPSDGFPRVLTLSATLDSAQEPNDASDSEATGTAQVIIIDDGNSITYNSFLDVTGISQTDLLPVAGVSSIHIHNAPAGVNGPVIVDPIQDAGGNVFGESPDAPDGNVIQFEVDQDTLINIENLEGSDDDDLLQGDENDNVLNGLGGNDTLVGGLGEDQLNGGEGIDTAVFNDIDVPVSVTLGGDFVPQGVRETGFSVEVDDQPLASLTTEQSPEELVEEAVAGNLYYNIHTTDFPGGEIRGQLLVESDETEEGVRTITLNAQLDAAQEPNGASDSEATGVGTVVIRVEDDVVTYSSDLSVEGIASTELLPVAGVSAIHLHNAPAGINGPVITDIVQDAGGDVNGELEDGGDVFFEVIERDNLDSIENVEGSNDDDLILGDENDNVLNGNDGDDTIRGLAGNDVLNGGAGNDILEGGADNDTLVGGLGNDQLDGGEGIDTVDFRDIDVAVNAALIEGGGIALRTPGFSVDFDDQPLESLTTEQSPEELVAEAVAGNLYYNIHTNDFPGGEIRGQLLVTSDVTEGGIRTITLNAQLDAAQEPDGASDSEATGNGTVVIVVDGDSVTYSSDLSVSGISPMDLLPVAGVSSIHLHNAPAGINGPVITDIFQDAGGNTIGFVVGGNGTVFDTVDELDTLTNIENIEGSNDPDTLIGSDVANVINGNDGDDNITGLGGNDTLNGGEGNDAISGGAGADTLIGGEGDDVLAGGGGVDIIDGGEGIDTNNFADINLGAADPSIAGVTVVVNADGTGTASYNGGGGNGPLIEEEFTGIENIIGSFNDDDIRAQGAAPNEINGLGGDDLIVGGGGADILRGGDDNDILRGGGGVDTIDGGEGIDTNDFSDINLGAADPSIAGVTVVVNADGSGTASYNGGGGNGPLIEEEFTGIENVTGSNNNDDIRALGAAPNEINGLDGDDFIAGGGGVDVLDGGEGNDTNSFINIGAEVIADLGSGSASYAPNENVTVFENFQGFENLDGSDNDDQLFGDGGANTLTGNDGDDLLVGRGGNDVLEGGEGNDVLQGGGGNDITDGGEGIDTADFQDIGSAVTANLGEGTATYAAPNGNEVADTLISIENLTGSENDDNLTGDEGDNLLAGGAGNDTIEGGAGNDVIRGDAIGDGEAITVTVTNTLGEGGTFLTPVWFGFHDGENFDLWTDGEAASGGLERIAEDGSIEGIAAEFNQEVGDGGVDATIIGGIGAPGPIDPGESASFTINVNADDVGRGYFTWATMVIPSNDAFLASPDNPLTDALFDEDGNFAGPLVIERFGSDVLDAGTEVNTEEGAAFLNQTARDQGTAENGVVRQHEGFNGSEGNPDGTPVNVLGGTTAAGTIVDPIEGDFTRNEGGEQLLRIVVDIAEGGDDILSGGAGEDFIDGGRGNDVLDGGTDNDRLEGGSGRDTFVFRRGTGSDIVADFTAGIEEGELLDVSDFGVTSLEQLNIEQDGENTVIDLGNGDLITLEGVAPNELVAENFVFGEEQPEVVLEVTNGDDDVVGGEAAENIDTGNGDDIVEAGGGDDTVDGGNGDDDLFGEAGNDQLTGGNGDDNIEGGLGNDVLIGGNGEDLLDGGEGGDTITGGRGDDILNGGIGNDTLEGGRGDDELNGGAGNDFICAGLGDDIINGGEGNDRLEGNRGADTFVFAANAGDDVITDFEAFGDDQLDLSAAALGFDSFADVSGAISQQGDDVVIDLGADGSITLLGIQAADLTDENVLF
ncbi:CHRD domain-containing protein [Ruegeria halocynthiae]|uniref:CHRD domain-containing protein n=1 Tax=Ruegeria halocynthiae TaxID=985054 RepID=UPI00055D54C5|nr:CHRD domain-containing protein [Ruegeria halocynthiae]